MKLYFAPIEGLGGYIYRNAQAELFPQADKYFAPFLSPGSKKRLTPKALRDISPDHNRNVNLVPQVLTNDAEAFIETAEELSGLGYREVNLNLGCPSKTVVNKGRGAGLLADTEALDRFLDKIFCGEIRISVKTRLGMSDPEEFVRILEIFNRYPISELTVHPRVQTDYYRNHPNREMFAYAVEHAKMPLVYNGDIFSAAAFQKFCADLSGTDAAVSAVMLGRGVLCDPALFGEIRSLSSPQLSFSASSPQLSSGASSQLPSCEGEGLTKERLWEFHERLLADYSEVLSGDSPVLFKMKELWYYMIHVFPDSSKYAKAIKKAQKMSDYREAVGKLFAERDIGECDF